LRSRGSDNRRPGRQSGGMGPEQPQGNSFLGAALMPTSPLHSRRWPACPERVVTSGYCPKHRKLARSGWEQRPTGNAAAYRGEWASHPGSRPG